MASLVLGGGGAGGACGAFDASRHLTKSAKEMSGMAIPTRTLVLSLHCAEGLWMVLKVVARLLLVGRIS